MESDTSIIISKTWIGNYNEKWFILGILVKLMKITFSLFSYFYTAYDCVNPDFLPLS